MTPRQPLLAQNSSSDYPASLDTGSLSVSFGLIVAVPTILWALDDPTRLVGLAAVIGLCTVFIRLANRFRRSGRQTFHVPGTELDVEVAVTRPRPSRSR
ncbi:hypothetical protein [Halocatena marina]|uniref:Uncharacterized protein n=1 Tax=Halocatena marina TaxID=2934937 RepID=A0ABD5YP49_9EURY|nr:hypothetical protein [Halocatena marina]